MVNRSMRAIARLAVLLPLVATSATLVQTRAADPFDEIFGRGLARRRTMSSLQARFIETTSSMLLNAPIVAHGTLVAATPARVRMTYADPEPKIVVIDGRTLTVVWPGRAERQQIDIGDAHAETDRSGARAAGAVDRSRDRFPRPDAHVLPGRRSEDGRAQRPRTERADFGRTVSAAAVNHPGPLPGRPACAAAL
jgi:hypothetical protein